MQTDNSDVSDLSRRLLKQQKKSRATVAFTAVFNLKYVPLWPPHDPHFIQTNYISWKGGGCNTTVFRLFSWQFIGL